METANRHARGAGEGVVSRMLPAKRVARDSGVNEWANRVLPHVDVGDSVIFEDLPAQQPARRIIYQQIARAAHRLWGVGCYQITAPPGAAAAKVKRVTPLVRAEPI